VPLLIALSLAAVVGDTVGYNIGARTGPRLFTRPDSLLFNRKHLITTKEFYERHGPFTIVIARFIPILRTFAPVVAGIGAMEYRRFISYNVIGGIGWVLTTVLGGYFLGQMIPNIHDHIHKVIVIVIVLSLLPAIIKVAREKMKLATRSER
jgi:membrane-associated protein